MFWLANLKIKEINQVFMKNIGEEEPIKFAPDSQFWPQGSQFLVKQGSKQLFPEWSGLDASSDVQPNVLILMG